ncbi:MAG: HEAT repeat domain-containing protein [Planctomycetaceae bacterium]
MIRILVVLPLLSLSAFGQAFEPKPSRSSFDMKRLREFINSGLSTPKSRGSLRKLGEPTRTIHGRLLDHDGKPIVGTAVSFSAEIGYSFHSYDENFDITDDNGRFVVEGDYTRERIAVWRGQHSALNQYVDHKTKTIEIRWPKPATCSLTFDRSLAEDESFGQKIWLASTRYVVGMSTPQRPFERSEEGPTILDNLLPGEYSVLAERTLTLNTEPAETKTFRVEVAKFNVSAGDEISVVAKPVGNRSLSGHLASRKQTKKGALDIETPTSMFVQVREQKRSYDHNPRLMDVSVIKKDKSFKTRPLPPGRYVISFVGPTPQAAANPQPRGFGRGGGWSRPSPWKRTYRAVVPTKNEPIVTQFPPKDSLKLRIQQALDTDGQMNVSYSYIDVQAAQVGKEENSSETILGMLQSKDLPNQWQYPLAKSLAYKLADEGVVQSIIGIVKTTEDEKLRGLLVSQLLRQSKILREEIAVALAPFRKSTNFRTRHMSYSTMCVHLTDANRDEVIPWLIEGLSDPYPRTRLDLCAWLGRMKAKAGLPKLEELSRNDPSGAIRVAAAHAAAQISGQKARAVQVMTVRLRGEKYCGQWEAAQLLSEYEDLPEVTIKALLAKVKTVKGPYGTLEKFEDNRISSTAKRTLEKVATGRTWEGRILDPK